MKSTSPMRSSWFPSCASGAGSRSAPSRAAAALRRNRKLVAGSYLGSAADAPAMVAANGNGHRPDPALMEVVSVRVPPKLKRALEQRAESEGRPAGAVVVDLLEKVDQQ